MRMHVYSVKYGFSQRFNVPARKAFDWSTDYRPDDLSLMKIQGKRRIRKITDDAILLNETTYKNKQIVRKMKLVRLDRKHLSWSNTHVSGPYLHSQFHYRIVPIGTRKCKLEFTGLLLCYFKANLSRKKIKQIARNERKQDSSAWHHLAVAMAEQVQ